MRHISFLILFLLMMPNISNAKDNDEKAIFAGGCFWCMVKPFDHYNGVSKVIAGYTGGKFNNPTYEEVSSGSTGHLEAVEITFDASVISYKELLDIFWQQIDPTDTGGQFADRGSQYKTAIFYANQKQREAAQESKENLAASGKFDKPIATKILKADKFYPAEEYHQDYYKKNPTHYNAYSIGSGRAAYLKETWSDDKKDLKELLSKMQYKVTQKDGTEPPFDNEYWDNKKAGIYVDIVSGEPLFSSLDKFKSGTGWPSFTKPLVKENIVEREDRRLFTKRIEVRSKEADSHLGHIFNDGPKPTGLRYCINSAALKFIPKEELDKEGYSEFKDLF